MTEIKFQKNARRVKENFLPRRRSFYAARLICAFVCGVTIFFAAPENFAQAKKSKAVRQTSIAKKPAANLPKVTQIDPAALKNLIKPNGKPLLVNFWATWCDPCVEEFPELVKISADYRNKLDVITVSMDDLAEINRDVPKFLARMKAQMPAYLLSTNDEETAIKSVSADWQGGLPFTILYNEKGEAVYTRQGKIKPETVRAEVEKLLGAPTAELPAPKIQNIDETALGKIINSQKGKPVFVNFWATWCVPCREEFSEVVKLYENFQPQGINFMSVSVDEFNDRKNVAAFLREARAAMPAYRLEVRNKDAMFTLMPFWSGKLPFTILYDAGGKPIYIKSGALDPQKISATIRTILMTDKKS